MESSELLAQREAVLAAFRAADPNGGGGEVDVEDLVAALRSLGGDAWAEELVAKATAGRRDGRVDYEEFLRWLWAGGSGDLPGDVPRDVPKAQPRLDREAAAARIWAQLGGPPGGSLPVQRIVAKSRYLERAFPEFRRCTELAEHGEVPWQAFLDLYNSPLRPTESPPSISREPSLPRPVARRGARQLQEIFEALDADGDGQISLEDVLERQDVLEERLPELLAKWSEMDVEDTGCIGWEAFSTFFGDDDDWLEFRLGEIVGLEGLKNQIRSFHRGVLLDRMRRERGLVSKPAGDLRLHMIFQGSPGTGKTSVGRLMASLLHKLGVLPVDRLVEVQQEQLVAGYVGQTAAKTQKVVDGAVGGVLFVDEAYRLAQGVGGSFGQEAIEQLMAAMSAPLDKAPTLILAGYRAEMQQFLAQNDGLYRRIPYTFDFPNYSCAELAEIFERTVLSKGFRLERALLENGRQHLAGTLELCTAAESRALMNGGLCEQLFIFAKQALDARDDPKQPTVVIDGHDLETACRQVRVPGTDDAGDSSEAARDIERLQLDVAALREERENLQREAVQTASLSLADPSATLLPAATLGGQLRSRSLRELLLEVRHLREEVSAKSCKLEAQAADRFELEERLRQLEDAMLPGTLQEVFEVFVVCARVEYLSASLNKWIEAVVEAFHETSGTYDLNIKKGVPRERLRALRRDAE